MARTDSARKQVTAQQASDRFFTPNPYNLTESEQAILTQAQIFPVTWRSAELTAFSWGKGPAVLLVHGWGGSSGQLSAFVHPLVAAGYRVLACDLPAHGRSPGTQTNGFEFASAIQTLADQEPALTAIVAHSWGAAATILALSQGLKADRAICISAACWLSTSVSTIAKLMRLSSEIEEELRGLIEQRFGETVWQQLSCDHRATQLQVPALLFHDQQDRKIAAEESRAIAAAWSGSSLVLTTGLGHDRILRDQSVIQQTVNFIQG
jgi:pimeloyl-ACP methyl ester carboxylesterase